MTKKALLLVCTTLASALLVSSRSFAQSATVAVPSAQSEINSYDIKPSRQATESKFKLIAGISGQRISDNLSRSSRGRGSLEIEGERRIFDSLSGFLSAGAYLANGNAASLFQNQDASYNYMSIARASIVYKPVSFGDVEAGILGRSFTTLPSAFRTDGFMGLSEKVFLGDEKATYVGLKAQQLLLNADPDKNAPSQSASPTLTTLGFDSQLKSSVVTLGISGHYFKFSKLPASAAVKSVDYNTTVPPIGPAAQFLFEFEGIQMGSLLEVEFSKRFTTALKTGFILNRKALDGASQGASAVLGAKYFVNPQVTIKPEAGIYYNESDVLPAVYVSNSYGNVNRRAYTAYLGVQFPEQNILMYGRLVLASEIQDRSYTADREIYLLGLEATYDIL